MGLMYVWNTNLQLLISWTTLVAFCGTFYIINESGCNILIFINFFYLFFFYYYYYYYLFFFFFSVVIDSLWLSRRLSLKSSLLHALLWKNLQGRFFVNRNMPSSSNYTPFRLILNCQKWVSLYSAFNRSYLKFAC